MGNTVLYDTHYLTTGVTMFESNDQHVVLPAEDFRELQATAFQNQTLGERAAGTVQTTLIFGAMAAAFVGASWGWAKAIDWRESRKTDREDASWQLQHPDTTKK